MSSTTHLHISFFIALLTLLPCIDSKAQELDFIRTDINSIEMNGDNWNCLENKIDSLTLTAKTKFNILHIGDSHIQADYLTEVTRRLLQQQFGNGGRGCIAALKLAGTNQPSNYTLNADVAPSRKCRLTKSGPDIQPGLTGIGISFKVPQKRSLTVTLHGDDSLFNHIALLHSPSAKYATASVDETLCQGTRLSDYATRYDLPDGVQSTTIQVDIDGTLYGAYLTNDQSGVIYNAIGNNGACYSDYLKIENFARQTELLSPDLIILSFGTNEAFGRSSNREIYANIDKLIATLKEANPKAKFLLTTPMECQRRIKRSRYAINRRIAGVRNVIMKYGAEKHVPVWDLYEIAGGEGASRLWLKNGLLSSRDHVHCQIIGYELQGSLLADALIRQLNPATHNQVSTLASEATSN